MRIISGKKRGAVLMCSEGETIRPTTDKVKEALFSMIAEYIPDAFVLDLFAGSGALSFEALSRGARAAVLVDNTKSSLGVIEKNRKKLGFESEAKIVASDAVEYVRHERARYDIIFMDPPYNKGYIKPIISAIMKNGLLNAEGIIVAESDTPDKPEALDGLQVIRERHYGRTYITIYTEKNKDEQSDENSSISGQL